jgi:hypothetical protein
MNVCNDKGEHSITIPKILNNDKFRFTILPGSKKTPPIDKNWQDFNNYKHDDEKLLSYLKKGYNYGVVCGFGNLVVLDSDNENLTKHIENTLPKTFTVQSSASFKKHFYYIIEEFVGISSLDGEKNEGHIKGHGSYVVGPNSKHPNVEDGYKILNGEPIETIKAKDLVFLDRYKHNKKASNVKGTVRCPSHPIFSNGTDIHPSGTIYEGGKFYCPKCGVGTKKAFEFKDKAKLKREILNRKGTHIIYIDESDKNTYLERCNIKPSNGKSYFTDKNRLIAEYQKTWPFVFDTSKHWWNWNTIKQYWEQVDEVDMLNGIYDEYRNNTVGNREKSEFINALKQNGRRLELIEPEKNWIRFKNKIVDVKTLKEIEISSNYFIRNVIPWNCSEYRETPVIDQLFEDWVGKDYIQTLKEITAYAMLKYMPLERIFCFIGGVQMENLLI